ncbi:hypothetical protein EXIGLDRAFT_388453 [Exidia glandulosa HHB12029]|uniref:Uncharacterized protein n=1 Tax=Exidia glandulosa HHB12029 TaxID=1314781 RepID=A0A165BUK5_EXIGL|nr:hypothetical protein EXIGLDRAFT_388453 [Exidia glandulosa HHB12029]
MHGRRATLFLQLRAQCRIFDLRPSAAIVSCPPTRLARVVFARNTQLSVQHRRRSCHRARQRFSVGRVWQDGAACPRHVGGRAHYCSSPRSVPVGDSIIRRLHDQTMRLPLRARIHPLRVCPRIVRFSCTTKAGLAEPSSAL